MSARRKSSPSNRAWIHGLLLLALLLEAGQAAGAVESAATLAELDLPGGSMAGSLIEIGQRYGVVVSFVPMLVERHVTPPIRGRYSLAQALTLALRGSDLSATVTPQGIVTLRAARQPAASTPDDDGDSASTSNTASEPLGSRYVMETVLVYGAAEGSGAKPGEGFHASSSDGATLTDTPLAQLPQAISVVTRDMLALTQAQTQIEVMDYVAGVTLQPGLVPQSGVVGKIRGFPAEFAISGMATPRAAFGVDAAFIERIEVIKGPGGAVVGVSETGGRGGLINVVRKRPHPGWRSEFTASAGSQDGGTLRSSFDIGSGDDQTRWRVAGYGMRSGRTDGGYSARYGEGLLAAISQRSDDVCATLTWQQDRRRDAPPAATTWGWSGDEDAYPAVDSGRQSPVSKDDGTSLRFGDAELDVEWRFSSAWRLRGKARWGRGHVDSRHHGYFPDQTTAMFERDDIRSSERARQWTLVGDVVTGPVKHTLLLGADAQIQRHGWGWTYAYWVVGPETFVPGRSELPLPDGEDSPIFMDLGQSRYTHKGVLLQDQMGIGPVRLRLAMRRAAFVETRDGWEVRSVGGQNWEAGMAYQWTPSTVVYAGAQSALEASYELFETLFDGNIAPAHRSRQAQAGVKFSPPDGRLSVTLEAYQIKRLGDIALNEELAGNQAQTVQGEHAEGIEAEGMGRLGPALDLAFGVNLMRAREHLNSAVQVQPYQVPTAAMPQHSMHLLGRYRLPAELARDTRIGMAFRAYSHTWASSPDPEHIQPSMRIPGGARLDLSWARQFGNGSLGVSLLNVFDRRLYGASTDRYHLPLLPGRSLSVTLAIKG